MRFFLALLCFIFLCSCAVKEDVVESCVREEICLNEGWRFKGGWLNVGMHADEYNASSWKEVNVPYDMQSQEIYEESLGAMQGYLSEKRGLFRQTFSVDTTLDRACAILSFDALKGDFSLWLNGEKLHEQYQVGGPAVFDVSQHLQAKNVLVVEFHVGRPRSTKYEGRGILGDVSLSLLHATHLVTHKQYWKCALADKGYQLSIYTPWVRDSVEQKAEYELSYRLIDSAGNLCASKSYRLDSEEGENIHYASMDLSDVALWSPSHPQLYSLETSLLKGGQCVDYCKAKLGFRYIEKEEQQELRINGQALEVRAVKLHLGCGAEGIGVSHERMYRRLKMLKGLGINVLVLQADVFPSFFYQQCEQLGFLVFSTPWSELIKGVGQADGEQLNLQREHLFWRNRQYSSFVSDTLPADDVTAMEEAFDVMEVGDWPLRLKSLGLINICDQPRIGYYRLQSRRSEHPILYVDGHWSYPKSQEGKEVSLEVVTNCDSLVWMLNDKQVLAQGISDGGMIFQHAFVPGRLVCKAYRQGVLVKEELWETVGRAYKLELLIDTTDINSEQENLIYVEIQAVDKLGRRVPEASNGVRLFVSRKAGEIISFDNANPLDMTSYASHKRQLYQGRAYAYVRLKQGEEGSVQLSAVGDDIIEAHKFIELTNSKKGQD